MIKLEHVVLESPEQMEFIIEGMRNPMNSWEKSDSEYKTAGYDIVGFDLGENDHSLMQRLSNAGTDHRKFMRMMPVYVRITAPLYWWKEFDTYKVGTVSNSCSTMHKIQAKEFTMEDFSCEHLNRIGTSSLWDIIDILNVARKLYLNGGEYKGENYNSKDKQVWWQMIQLLPSSYNQTRNVMMNYEVLANIYKSRRGHKLDEWVDFCHWIESLPYSEIIMSSSGLDLNSINALQGAARNSSKGYIYKRKKRRIKQMNGMVKVKDILPLVKWNDVRLVLGEEDEICLLRKDFIAETLSDKILGMMVTGIENDEAILDTVNIYVFGYKKED